MPKILILCTGNACRSQMAEGYLKQFAKGRAEIYSAGTEIHGVHPMAVRLMQQDGVDISKQTCHHVDEYANMHFDYIITLCDHAKEHCPSFPSSAKKLHHSFPDPAKAAGTDEEIRQTFREVRDMIKAYAKEFVRQFIH